MENLGILYSTTTNCCCCCCLCHAAEGKERNKQFVVVGGQPTHKKFQPVGRPTEVRKRIIIIIIKERRKMGKKGNAVTFRYTRSAAHPLNQRDDFQLKFMMFHQWQQHVDVSLDYAQRNSRIRVTISSPTTTTFIFAGPSGISFVFLKCFIYNVGLGFWAFLLLTRAHQMFPLRLHNMF